MDDICAWDTILDHVARAVPTTKPGDVARYHYLSFGWIVGGIVRFEIASRLDSTNV